MSMAVGPSIAGSSDSDDGTDHRPVADIYGPRLSCDGRLSCDSPGV